MDVDTFLDDIVDDIFIEGSLSISPFFTNQRTYRGISGNARLELSFRVQCSQGFTGGDCSSMYLDNNSVSWS